MTKHRYTHLKGIDPVKLANILKLRRIGMGLNQTEFGSLSKISSCTVSSYEANRSNLSIQTLKLACLALSIDITEVLDECSLSPIVTLSRLERKSVEEPVVIEPVSPESDPLNVSWENPPQEAIDKEAYDRKISDAISFLKGEGMKIWFPVMKYEEI